MTTSRRNKDQETEKNLAPSRRNKDQETEKNLAPYHITLGPVVSKTTIALTPHGYIITRENYKNK
jgi:hypothetical protein